MTIHDYTTIQISKTTRVALANSGKKGQTYDEIILHLLANFGEKNEQL